MKHLLITRSGQQEGDIEFTKQVHWLFLSIGKESRRVLITDELLDNSVFVSSIFERWISRIDGHESWMWENKDFGIVAKKLRGDDYGMKGPWVVAVLADSCKEYSPAEYEEMCNKIQLHVELNGIKRP